jgi:alcohol dehydrogenase class IV
MSLASLCGGMALANAGLGAVHGLAGPIGGMFPAPHGAVCGILLPGVMEANIRVLRHRGAGDGPLARYRELARILTGDATAEAEDGMAWVRALVTDLAIPPLARSGLCAAEIPAVVAKAEQAASMKGNPVVLSTADLEAILAEALGSKA